MVEKVGYAKGKRYIALIIDNILALAISIFLSVRFPFENVYYSLAFLIITYYLYFFLQEAMWARTIGKAVLGLVIYGLDGKPCSWGQAAMRTVWRLFEVNPYLIGGLPAGIVILNSKKKQRIGDMLAGTIVIEKEDIKVYFGREEEAPAITTRQV